MYLGLGSQECSKCDEGFRMFEWNIISLQDTYLSAINRETHHIHYLPFQLSVCIFMQLNLLFMFYY